ncbi:hypothetical protein [Streptomyces longwoodensis]|uniref:hypothetical protein n=1 Tax=Streptomyces longwoodensis TaxID=68231 RepID=UPI0036F91250
MSSQSSVWRYGQMNQEMVPPEGAAPVPEPFKAEPRRLVVQEVSVSLHCHDGVWAAGTAALYGVWLRKDGKPGTRNGNILLGVPTSTEEGSPPWLARRLAALLDGLNTAYAAVEAADTTG